MIFEYNFNDDYFEYDPDYDEIKNALLDMYGEDYLLEMFINKYYSTLSPKEIADLKTYYNVNNKSDLKAAGNDPEFFEDVVIETLKDHLEDFKEDLMDYFEDAAREEFEDAEDINDVYDEWNRYYYSTRL